MLLATLINIRAPFRWSPRLMCILLKNECIWIRTRNIKFERPYFDTFSTSNVFYEPVCGILRARFSCHFVQKFMPTYSRPFEFWRIIIWYKKFLKHHTSKKTDYFESETLSNIKQLVHTCRGEAGNLFFIQGEGFSRRVFEILL